MTASIRACLAIALFAYGLAGLSAQTSPPKTSGKKPTHPNIKEVEAKPTSFLGSRLTLQAWLAPTSKAVGSGAELSVLVDAKTPAKQVRFLAAKSLADSVAEFKETRRVQLTGTLLAAESVRSGHVFEVEEIGVLDERDAVVQTLKPAAGSLSVSLPVEKPAVEPVPEKEPHKPGEPVKKSGASPALVVGAALMATILAALFVVGLRLMKYMKGRPSSRRQRPVASAATVDM